MKSALLFCCFILVLGICSCGSAPPAYVPNKMHVPLFTKQGDFFAEGSINASVVADAAIAYSPVNNFMFTASMNTKTNHDDTDGFSTHYYEVEAGYYHALNSNTTIEILGGFGKGDVISKGYNTLDKPLLNLDFWWPSYNIDTFMHVNGKYSRYSLELHLGTLYRANQGRELNDLSFQTAVMLRMSYLHFNQLSIRRDYYEQGYIFDSTYTIPSQTSEKTANAFFPEVAIMGRMNFGPVGFELQMGFTSAGSKEFTANSVIYSAGLVFRF